MAKLYEFDTETPAAPKLLKADLTASDAGKIVFERESEDNDFSRWWFLLVQNGRLYYYVSVPGGYGWESADGEDGPPFADYDKI